MGTGVTGTGLDVQSLTQMVFSVGVSWYLLVTFRKELKTLSTGIHQLHTLVQNQQKETLDSSEETKEMFVEIKNLIKETSGLVQTTSESVKIQNELTRLTLARLDRWSDAVPRPGTNEGTK